jgi:hypothetical protein
MKTDVYTKCVLTVIACCLLYIVARDVPAIQNAHANAVVDVNIVRVAGAYIPSNDGVPVKIK